MLKAIGLTLLLVLSGCASFPQWSDKPQDCGRWDDGFSKDLYSGVKKQLSRKYICVENPEVVKLPAYLELLNLPPAKDKPVVAVYNFLDKTGQRKSVQNIASLYGRYTDNGSFIP